MKTLSFFISIIVALFVFTNNICAQNEVKVSNGKSLYMIIRTRRFIVKL